MPVILAMCFVFGSIIGSFLNVCIFRIPKEESIVFPASHCQACKKPLRPQDNVPILSFIWLGGRCHFCKDKISVQYPIIEFITGVLFVVFFLMYGPTIRGAIYLVFSLALLVATMIDIRHRIIPDEISVYGTGIAFALSGIFPDLHGQTLWWKGLLQSFIGLMAGGGFLYVTAIIGEWLFKKEAMGGGDIKLLALIGALLGWQASIWTIFVSSIVGSVFGIYFRLKDKQEYFAFGPYIALGAFLYLFVGPQAVQWYKSSLWI